MSSLNVTNLFFKFSNSNLATDVGKFKKKKKLVTLQMC